MQIVNTVKELKIGMIGNKWMGKAHTHGYTDIPLFTDLNARAIQEIICGRSADCEEIAKKWGWNRWTNDWHDIINDPEIDAVDICAPSILHAEIAIAAAKAGKHVLCEKPMAMNLASAREMVEVAKATGVVNMVGFNYRCVPAIVLAKKLIDEGAIGEVFHFRGVYPQDWQSDPNNPITWRSKRNLAGSGVHGDQGSHVIDVMRYWIGEVDEVVCDQRIYTKNRVNAATGVLEEVDADDASAMIVRFKDSAAIGYVESSRNGTGHKNQNRIEVNGEKGSIIFNMEEMNVLQYYDATEKSDRRGFRTIQVTEPNHPYMRNWWAVGHIIGYGDTFIHQARNFVDAIANGKQVSPDFRDGYECQRILEAGQISYDEHSWVKIDDVR